MRLLMLMASTSETDCNCPPPPSAPRLFSSFFMQPVDSFAFFQSTHSTASVC
jgi:hypothetical protein